jgi:hypothetical protein
MSARVRLPVLAAALLAAALACELPAGIPGVDPNLLYQEDFEDGTTTLALDDDEDTTSEIRDGEYFFEGTDTETVFWTTLEDPDHPSFTDTTIDVDTRFVGGPEDGSYGVICRQSGMWKFYLFEIAPTGDYAISKATGPVSGIESLIDWERHDAIETGTGAENHLTVTCAGDTLTLAINGREVASIEDGEYESGDVGLAVATEEEGGVRVAFDNLRVTRPGSATPVK